MRRLRDRSEGRTTLGQDCLRSGGYTPAVVDGKPVEGQPSREGQAEVRALQEALQLRYRTGADARNGVIDQVLQLRRQGRGLADRAAPAGYVQVALDAICPLTRRLVRRALPNPVEDVVVELVQANVAVLVTVGLTRLEAVDQSASEDRRLFLMTVGQMVAFEGILHRARRGDHRPTATTEPLLD